MWMSSEDRVVGRRFFPVRPFVEALGDGFVNQFPVSSTPVSLEVKGAVRAQDPEQLRIVGLHARSGVNGLGNNQIDGVGGEGEGTQ